MFDLVLKDSLQKDDNQNDKHNSLRFHIFFPTCNYWCQFAFPNNVVHDDLVSLIGILTNLINIWFLVKKRNKLDFAKSFTNVLILLSVFDLIHLLSGIVVFVIPELSTWFSLNIYPHVLPVW